MRRYEDELKFLEQISPVEWRIKKGFVPGMTVDGSFYLNSALFELQMEELMQHSKAGGVGGFLPAVKQIANVAALPGIVRRSVAMPDCHSGYGFAIGNVAAFDMDDPTAVVSPGGVGFDINCGVRAIRTNLTEADVRPHLEQLTQSLFDHIPVGVGSKGVIPTTATDLEAALELGIDWSLREGYAWAEDKEHCFAPETRVLMADGTTRAIGECAVGDRLVDETGSARTITRSSRGKGRLFEVAYGPDAEARFVCNAGHQLVVVVKGGASTVEVTATDADGAAADFDSPSAANFLVSSVAVLHDSTLGFAVPSVSCVTFGSSTAAEQCAAPGSSVFASARDARAAALAFARQQCESAAAAPLLWEPTVSQYRAFAATYPARQAWCTMARVALPALPDATTSRARNAAPSAYSLGRSLASDAYRTAPVHAHMQAELPLQTQVEQPPCDRAAAARVEPEPPVSSHALDAAAAEAAAQAILADAADVRAELLAGLVDAAGAVRPAGDGWDISFTSGGSTGATNDANTVARRARLAWRIALSLGYAAHVVADSSCDTAAKQKQGASMVLQVIAPSSAEDDLVSTRLRCVHKRLTAARASNAASTCLPHGWQLHHFSIAPAGAGVYVSVEVDGPSHRFLLADHLLVHNCEEYGRLLMADPSKVSKRAKKRGLPQLGTLGAGNHYAEVQVVDEIYDKFAASRMGIEEAGQVMIMIHSGSRGLGHQVATDALVEMEAAMARDGIKVNDRQLACARISSPEGQAYLSGMAAAANYAFVNRASMTFLVRQAFAKTFKHLADSPDDLDMALVYDVSHNIAKVEEHFVDGRPRKLLVHRKGATRAFGPHHPLLPVDYQFTGQPVIIGGEPSAPT